MYSGPWDGEFIGTYDGRLFDETRLLSFERCLGDLRRARKPASESSADVAAMVK